MRGFVSTVVCSGAIVTSLCVPRAAAAQVEVCGDGVDNDSDGVTDNGCNPAGVLGVCEQPLSCARTGSVSPLKGQLVYREDPDLSIRTPFGPALSFQRTYFSQYDPGYNSPSATDYKAPMGYGWQHNYQSYLELDGTEVVVHIVTGQDILSTYASSSGGYDYYDPQAGAHYDYLRHKTSGGQEWELRTLTGNVYVYNWSSPIGKLSEIRDSVGNAVTITYNGDGQVDTVKDASGYRELVFEYEASGDELLQYVKYYLDSTLEVTVTLVSADYELTSVDVGSDVWRRYTWSNSFVARAYDGAGKTDAYFHYVDGGTGKVARIETGDGEIGYEYGVSNMTCTGTYVTYNRADQQTCDVDSDCDGDLVCGGQTDPGTGYTGSCFRARRCLSITSGKEDMIDAIDGYTDAGSCPSCVDTKTYSWDATSLDLDGRESADSVWTSFLYNSDGLLTKRVEGDTDDDATTAPAGSRVTFYFHGDSDFPGLVTEVRRLSELKPAGTCTTGTTTDCKRTINTYTSEGLLDTVQQIGFTKNTSGTVVSYSYTSDYDYDGSGRLTDFDGPRTDTSYDHTLYTYYSNTDGTRARAAMLKEVKRQTASATYLVTTLDSYEPYGHATSTEDPNGQYTCRMFDGDRGVLSELRVAMNGQGSCASPHSSDLVTGYTYDESLRTTRIDRPEGNCVFYEYDSLGRLEELNPRDNCSRFSAGDTMAITYNAYGQQIKVEYKDASDTVTFRREMTYRDDRRLASVINPEATSYEKTYAYDDDGMLASITGEDDVGKIESIYDALNREDTKKRYTGSSTFDTWDLTPGKQLMLPTSVEDDDSKSIDWVWDDMGRKVEQVTPDSGTTRYGYDPAGNMTTKVEADGTADEATHTYSYDPQNRILTEDWGISAQDCAGAGAEIQYVYDSDPSSCPGGETCDNLAARLAYTKTKMFCDDTEPDETVDQETTYSYDPAGRIVATFVEDDTGRSADTTYTWDENGNVLSITAPSGVAIVYEYNDGSENSDADKPHTLKRDTTTLTDNGTWMPFGPMDGYRQSNTVSSSKISAAFSWDLAYRPTEIKWYLPATGVSQFEMDYIYDVQGRLRTRSFTNAHASVQDAYYDYDWLNRVTCDAADEYTSCPGASDPDLKSDLSAGYTPSGERIELVHDGGSSYGEHTYTFNLVSGSDQIDEVSFEDATAVTYGWDGRGTRTFDDYDESTDDTRTYDHDGRGRTITIDNEYAGLGILTTNVYDERNRRVFQSVYYEWLDKESHYFFYYDVFDRLIEIKLVNDIETPTAYTVFQFYWIGNRPIAYYQVTYPSTTTSRRYYHADEIGRPLDAWSWPTSGSASRVWAMDPDVFGWDRVVQGWGQPLRFPGQIYDQTTAGVGYVGGVTTYTRPPLHENRARYYDPMTGTYLSVDPRVEDTWEAYNYVEQNPVMKVDPTGEFSLGDLNPLSWSFCTWCYIEGAALFVWMTQICGNPATLVLCPGTVATVFTNLMVCNQECGTSFCMPGMEQPDGSSCGDDDGGGLRVVGPIEGGEPDEGLHEPGSGGKGNQCLLNPLACGSRNPSPGIDHAPFPTLVDDAEPEPLRVQQVR